jgi:hypothetical protein
MAASVNGLIGEHLAPCAEWLIGSGQIERRS